MSALQHFVVPQFIDIESKILGPITTRQFLWVLGGGLIFFVAMRTMSRGAFVGVAIVDVIFFGSFAFLKVNGQLFHNFLVNFIAFLRRPRLYIWHQVPEGEERSSVAPVLTPVNAIRPSVAQSRLRELALIVDTGGSYQPLETFKSHG